MLDIITTRSGVPFSALFFAGFPTGSSHTKISAQIASLPIILNQNQYVKRILQQK
jgi:hypothetical protein